MGGGDSAYPPAVGAVCEPKYSLVAETPSYVSAAIIFAFVFVSILFERGLHMLEQYLQKKKSSSRLAVLHGVKDELMLLGFIAILLMVCEPSLVSICVPKVSKDNPFLPCPQVRFDYNNDSFDPYAGQASSEKKESDSKDAHPSPSYPYSPPANPPGGGGGGHASRRLLGIESELPSFRSSSYSSSASAAAPGTLVHALGQIFVSPRRRLGGFKVKAKCPKGKQQLITQLGVLELHYLIFFLAMIHIVYCGLTMLLARLKVHLWRRWEEQAQEEMKRWMHMTEEEREAELAKQSKFIQRHTRFVRLLKRMKKKKSKVAPAAAAAAVEAGASGEGSAATVPDPATAVVAAAADAPDSAAEIPRLTAGEKIALGLASLTHPFRVSVSRDDYNALRLGFITNNHLELDYDFHSFCVRCLEYDFRHIVGTSWHLWLFTILLVLLSFVKPSIIFFVEIFALVCTLIVGSQLTYTMSKLALEVSHVEQAKGGGAVGGGGFAGQELQARDELFCCNMPAGPIYMIQFILFQTSFNLAMYLWKLWAFGFVACKSASIVLVYVGLGLSIVNTILLAFVTLPLYAILRSMAGTPRVPLRESQDNGSHGHNHH